MTTVVLAAAWVGAAVLASAGMAKLRRPEVTSTALQVMGLPSRAVTARLLGVGEVALGAFVLLAGGRLALLALATAYAVFAVVAARQRRAGATCGCFGDATAPVTRLHVVANGVFALASAAAASGAAGGVASAVPGGPVPFAAAVVLLAVAAVLVRLLLTGLPRLAAERTRTATVLPDRAGVRA